MARLAKHTATGPIQIGKPKDNLWICQCGLSKNAPFCDGAHQTTQDEDSNKIYEYDEQGIRKEVKIKANDGCCCS